MQYSRMIKKSSQHYLALFFNRAFFECHLINELV